MKRTDTTKPVAVAARPWSVRVKYLARTAHGLAAAATAVVLLATAGCTRETSGEQSPEDKGLQREFTRGPLHVQVSVDRTAPTIADQINLEIAATIEEDYQVKLPRFGEKLEQFGIVDYRTFQPELTDDGKMRTARSYVLEPFLSGDYTIPPMTVLFWEDGQSETNAHALETEAIPIQVKSLLPDTVEDLEIHEIADPVSLPRSMKAPAWVGISGAAILLLALVIALVIRRRRAVAPALPPELLAHEIAYAALEQLVGEDLIAKGEIKQFYQRVSDILRRYIENRFGLHAPEQTTEEFLRELGESSALTAPHKQLLRDFLGHCDLVKFAALQPATEDIQRTFDSCKTFIEETRKVEKVSTE